MDPTYMSNAFELNYNERGFNLTILNASEGKKEEVDALLAEGGKLADAVYGYALGGRDALVAELLKQHPERPELQIVYSSVFYTHI